jgi:hypothetical protein
VQTTQSRDYYDARWGGNPAYHGCFIMRWFSSVAACQSNGETGTKFSTRGGWFDTLGTNPESYIEQARQTILGGATESFLFEAGALMGVDGPGGKADAEALRANMVELQHVAQQVGSRLPIGITAYKPPNSHSGARDVACSREGAEEQLFSFVGQMGFPLLPLATFPDLSTGEPLSQAVPLSAMFSMHSLKDPLLIQKLGAYAATGRPTLVTDNLVKALDGQLDLSSHNVHTLTVGASGGPSGMLNAPQKVRDQPYD